MSGCELLGCSVQQAAWCFPLSPTAAPFFQVRWPGSHANSSRGQRTARPLSFLPLATFHFGADSAVIYADSSRMGSSSPSLVAGDQGKPQQRACQCLSVGQRGQGGQGDLSVLNNEKAAVRTGSPLLQPAARGTCIGGQGWAGQCSKWGVLRLQEGWGSRKRAWQGTQHSLECQLKGVRSGRPGTEQGWGPICKSLGALEDEMICVQGLKALRDRRGRQVRRAASLCVSEEESTEFAGRCWG